MRISLLALAIAACAPAIDGPIDHQRAIDRDDGDRFATQLAHLPGVVSASVVLRRPVADPLAVTPPGTPALAAVIVTDDQADRAAITATATQLSHAIAPEVTAPAIAVMTGYTRPELASVGPFTVAASSRNALRAVLAIGLALIAAFASLEAWRRYRLGRSAQ